MSGADPGPDILTATAVAAVEAARRVRHSLYEAIPALPPQRRVFAGRILRHLERDTYLERDVLRDIEIFLDLLRREIAAGTHEGWRRTSITSGEAGNPAIWMNVPPRLRGPRAT